MKMNYRRYVVLFGQVFGLILCLMFFSCIEMGCQTLKYSVPYREVLRIEVHTNQQGLLTFKMDYLMSSFCGIGTYNFTETKDGEGRRFYLSLFRGEEAKSNIKEDMTRGVEIQIPVQRFDAKIDSCWYLDTNGVHRIEIGTPQSWDDYLRTRANRKHWRPIEAL